MTEEQWDGRERRTVLIEALGDVRDLRLGVADLTEAVRIRAIEFQRVIRQVALLLAVLLVVLITFSMFQIARLNERLDRGHGAITCLLLLEPADRTVQTLIDCQRGAR